MIKMVIRPSDIKRSKLTKSIENKIDSTLKEGSRTYYTEAFDSDTIEEIIEKYRNAGWKVKMIYDQRDGNYLEFRE